MAGLKYRSFLNVPMYLKHCLHLQIYLFLIVTSEATILVNLVCARKISYHYILIYSIAFEHIINSKINLCEPFFFIERVY